MLEVANFMEKSKFQERIEKQQKRLEELYEKHFNIRHYNNELEKTDESGIITETTTT